METLLPEEMLAAFLRGEHVCHHHGGFWNAVFLEQTYIRYGKATGGLVGKSLPSEQVSEWVLSQHNCNAMSLKMYDMFIEEGEDEFDKKGGRHKEEGKNRKKLDTDDRTKILNEILQHTNPLLTLPDDPLHNTANDRVADSEVNVDEALAIGERMSAEYLA